MKTLVFQVFLVFFSISYQGEVWAQSFYPAPIVYNKSDDEDIGLLLAVLLLAAKNKNGNCNCCSCCKNEKTAKNIPIPYPIPFPVNNALITRAPMYDEEGENNNNNGGKDVLDKKDMAEMISKNIWEYMKPKFPSMDIKKSKEISVGK